jgi:hypothetical protein
MSGNLIGCIICLVLGIAMLGLAIYSAYRMIAKDEEYMVIPLLFFGMIGLVVVLSSAIHWNDDKEYKTIDCSGYYIDTNVKYSKGGQADTTYTIHYK